MIAIQKSSHTKVTFFNALRIISHTHAPDPPDVFRAYTSKVMLLEELMMKVILDEELFEVELFDEALFQTHHLLSVPKR